MIQRQDSQENIHDFCAVLHLYEPILSGFLFFHYLQRFVLSLCRLGNGCCAADERPNPAVPQHQPCEQVQGTLTSTPTSAHPPPVSLASSMWTTRVVTSFATKVNGINAYYSSHELAIGITYIYYIYIDTIWYNTQRNRVLLKVDNINCKYIKKYYQYIVCKREATLQTMPCRSSRLLKPMPTSWHDPVCICFSFMAVQWNI